MIRRLAFEAAIASADEKLTSIKVSRVNSKTTNKGADTFLVQIREQLDQGGSPIESGYKGPRLPSDGSPTADFIDSMIDWFKDGNVLPRRVAWQIILGAYDVLKEEETLVDVEIPAGETIDVIGDTHGQYYDFMNLLSLTGKPSPTHTLLFNGDFVDRGSWSTEILLVLLAYKWLYPTKIYLNRGNHETCKFPKVVALSPRTKLTTTLFL